MKDDAGQRGLAALLSAARRWRGHNPYRLLTVPLRMRPEFLIAGAMKCGTTSLYNYLGQHPRVAKARKKELHYFDWNYHLGPVWYASQFPVSSWHGLSRSARPTVITGEASTDYLFHPRALERIVDALPSVKLIVLVRNPVDRAYSHYHHERKQGVETATFEQAVAEEPRRLAGEVERLRDDPGYSGHAYRRYSYLARGIYVDGVCSALDALSPSRVLVMRSEDLFDASADAMARVLEFLELPVVALAHYPKLYAGRYPPMAEGTRRELLDYFRPHNQRLADVLGRDLDWDR